MSKVELPKIVSPDFKPYWDEGISNETYHSDKSAVSSSALKKILKSPASFYSNYLDGGNEQTEAMRLGSIIHMAILEPKKFFSRYVKQPHFGDLRSTVNKKAKEEWAFNLEQTNPDAVVLSEAEFIQIEGMVNSVSSHKDASSLLKHGNPEITGYFRDPITGIKCKIRPDLINFDLMVLLDIKTTEDCTHESFSKSIWNYRYDFQMAYYYHGIECITGKVPSYGIYMAIEKRPPYEVGVWVADDTLIRKGMEDYRKALDKLAQCLESNQWPAYQSTLETISLPRWATVA
jgi:hypothetical protein